MKPLTVSSRRCWPCALTILSILLSVQAQELTPIPLPSPGTNGGKPLMQALSLRRTTREIKPDPLPEAVLGDLLWAAFGVNRPETGQRTAPSAMNSQEIDLYVALPKAVYLYEAKTHSLNPLLAGDSRARISSQEFAKQAPVVLLYVADLPRLAKAKPESRPFYAGIDTGCLVQNVYLYCASAGLATVVFDLNRPPLVKALHLRADQQIILGQAIGYPAKASAQPKDDHP